MIEVLKKKNNSLIYKTSDYLRDYNSNNFAKIDYKLYSKIIQVFFSKCVTYIFTGKVLSLPIGKFQVQKRDLNPLKLRISFAETNKLRRETGDSKAIAYRQKNYMYEINSNIRIADYIFKPVKNVYLKIPLYFL